MADLGGKDTITTQQAAVIDLAVKTKLILDSIDAWLLMQSTLVSMLKRALLPVVRDRQQLVDSLVRILQALGLEPRASKIPDLNDYVRERYGAANSTPSPDSVSSQTRSCSGLTLSPAQETLLRAIYALLKSTDHRLELYRLCTGRQDPQRDGLVTVVAGAREAPSCVGLEVDMWLNRSDPVRSADR